MENAKPREARSPRREVPAYPKFLESRDPATGEVLRKINTTPLENLPDMFRKARVAQHAWAAVPLRQRARHLINLRETIIIHADEIIDLISKENGKPKFDALTADVLAAVEVLTYFGRKAPKILRRKKISLQLLKHRASYLDYWPLGVVAVISPWNAPFFLALGEIAMALVAGNTVIAKPSEVTPLVGIKIQELCEEAGIPPNVIQTVLGDGTAGQAIIEQKPAKVFFTGSVGTGKKIMTQAAKDLTPVCLELGGKDAMIVMPDSNLDFATSAALWGGFANTGQYCASTERLLLHESIAPKFLKKLTEKISHLRQGNSETGDNDLGPITLEKQKEIYRSHISQAKDEGADFLTGGNFSSDKNFLRPTVVTCEGIEKLDVYRKETFGPVMAVSKFKSVNEAVRKTNRSPYGLTASVITNNVSMGEDIARQLQVGAVTVNEAAASACAMAETPWGGVKNSGFGRKHGEVGLMEFVNIRHVNIPKYGKAFKALWWFPYTKYQYQTFRKLLGIYRKSWFDKARAIPNFLWNMVTFLKGEKRL